MVREEMRIILVQRQKWSFDASGDFDPTPEQQNLRRVYAATLSKLSISVAQTFFF